MPSRFGAMTRSSFLSWNGVLGVAAIFFLVIQVRLYQTQVGYNDQIAEAIRGENDCTTRMSELVDRLATTQESLTIVEDEKRQLEQKVHDLSNDLDRKDRQDSNETVRHEDETIYAAVVIMACNRPDYLQRTIDSVLKYHRAVSTKFPLFISQDGNNVAVETVARKHPEIFFMQHLDFELPNPRPAEHMLAYYKIASHYKWALSSLFSRFLRVIILEDDMEIAPDFFEYFEATGKLLDNDRSLMAVSSWNDNGQRQFVHDPETLYRSDFFPGLGWMLNKNMWDELAPKWPDAFWDDWMRLKANRKDRQFIRPEVCRTYNFGEHGSSAGQFFKDFLEPIKINDVKVKWKTADLTYLREPYYSREFEADVNKAMPIPAVGAVDEARKIEGDVRIEYSTQAMFEQMAQQFGVFREWKDGVPRTAYKGIVVFRWQGARRVFFVPSDATMKFRYARG